MENHTKEKHRSAWETMLRSTSKTLIYRAGSLAIVTPITALTVAYFATGHLSWDAITKAILAGTVLSNLVYNSLYYYFAERIASRLHWGYKIPFGRPKTLGQQR